MTTFFRLVDEPEKEAALLSSTRNRSALCRFQCSISELRTISSSPFAYWFSNDLRSVYSNKYRNNEWTVAVGLQTSDDFRFVRVWWEAGFSGLYERWWPAPVGGRHTFGYRDLSAVVNWFDEGRELQNFSDPATGKLRSRPQNIRLYFRPGLTWPQRGRTFSAQAVPADAIFTIAGIMAFGPRDQLLAYLALFNSQPFDRLMGALAGKVDGVRYIPGLVEAAPLPIMSGVTAADLELLAKSGWSARRSLDTVVEVSHAFVVPAVLQVDGVGFDNRVLAWAGRVAGVEAELERVQFEIDELCFELYGISEEDRRAITEGFGVTGTDDEAADDSNEDESDAGVELDPVGLAAGLVSWAVGVAAGRFDVRLAIGERDWPVEPDPFDPLPVCSAGMLTGADGLPATSLPAGYPLVPSPILVDDPGHELDIAARVRAVFDVLFGDDADIWWSDIGAALDTKNGVEGWLRRGFFDHHLKTYSKSRRKAPLMWPIGTRSGLYQVWLYAHSVTPDSLFRLLGDVIEPKLAAEQRQLSDLAQEFGPSPTASQHRSLDVQQKLVDEITELRDEIRAGAALWHPDLNDGIVIVLAPLWRLFAQHRAWSKELKDRWVKLAKGDYDWAQLAMHIWPERVIPKCANDRSLAIAHNLEDTFWTQDDTNPDKWHPRHTPTTPIDQLIADRTNPTATNTRNHPNP